MTAGNLVRISLSVLEKHPLVVCFCDDNSKFQQSVINCIIKLYCGHFLSPHNSFSGFRLAVRPMHRLCSVDLLFSVFAGLHIVGFPCAIALRNVLSFDPESRDAPVAAEPVPPAVKISANDNPAEFGQDRNKCPLFMAAYSIA